MDYAEALAVLDLKPGASAAEIDDAYKAAVRAWHPDRFNHSPDMRTTAEARLKRINEARTVLDGTPLPAHNSEVEPQYVDDLVRYLGTDPRLPTQGLLNLTGFQATVRVTRSGILLLVFKNPQTPDHMAYPRDFILRIHQGTRAWGGLSRRSESVTREDRCVVLSRDPNGVESHLFIQLQFRNTYYAKLFAQSAADLLALREVDNGPILDTREPSRRSGQSSPPEPPLQADSSNARPNRSPESERQKQTDEVVEISIPRGCILSLAVIVWTFMIAGLLIALLGQHSTPTPPLATAETTRSATSSNQPPEGQPPDVAGISVPNYAITKGSFSVWAEPEDPSPNQPYQIVIQIRLPADLTARGEYPLNGDLTAAVRGTDGYTKTSSFKGEPLQPIVDGTVTAFIRIPGAAQLIRDHIKVTSKMLNETHEFDIEF